MNADELADDLAEVLFRLETGRSPTSHVTLLITRAVLTWAIGRGWSPRTEATIQATGDDECGRLGFVDVLVRRGGGLPDVAIEIDSTDKQWSVDKLSHVARLGMRAIWIRWGEPVWAGSHDGVDVIQLPNARYSRSRTSSAGQLAFWR